MKLWIRKLSCGHERPTSIAFICGKYEKPKIKDDCYCRECCNDFKVVGVKRASKIMEEQIKKFKKLKKDGSVR